MFPPQMSLDITNAQPEQRVALDQDVHFLIASTPKGMRFEAALALSSPNVRNWAKLLLESQTAPNV
jgi:hypothetical protein